MSDGVLPAFLVLLEVRKPSGDVCVDLAEGRPLLTAVLYRHRYQGHVAERGLLVCRVVAAIADLGPGPRGGPVYHCGRRGRCRRRRRVAVAGAVQATRRRGSFLVQVMRTGA